MPSSQPPLITSLDHTIVLVTTNIADTSSRPTNAQHLYLPIWGTKLRLRGGRYGVYMAISQPSSVAIQTSSKRSRGSSVSAKREMR